jgi:hypothetical protein
VRPCGRIDGRSVKYVTQPIECDTDAELQLPVGLGEAAAQPSSGVRSEKFFWSRAAAEQRQSVQASEQMFANRIPIGNVQDNALVRHRSFGEEIECPRKRQQAAPIGSVYRAAGAVRSAFDRKPGLELPEKCPGVFSKLLICEDVDILRAEKAIIMAAF